MPRLGNERQELYAINRARGMIPARAAVASGYASGSAIYSTLESDVEVINRVNELITELEERKETRRTAAIASAKKVGEMTGFGRAWVLERLAENAALAQEAGDFKCATESLKLIGMEFGLFDGSSASEKDQAHSALASLDFDRLDRVLDNLPPDPTTLLNTSRPVIDASEALALIEGQGKTAERIRRSRAIDTNPNSETNVGLTMDDEPTDVIEEETQYD